MNFQTTISKGGIIYKSLADIIPDKGKLKVLFVGKRPIQESVDAGHYFQGQGGQSFWNKLAEYNILKAPFGHYEDEHLLCNGFGIMDIVKAPGEYGNEPSIEEYKEGIGRLFECIKKYEPKLIVFVYKRILDKILTIAFDIGTKSKYGFNESLERYFGSKVFVFTMPGIKACNKKVISDAMNNLQAFLKSME